MGTSGSKLHRSTAGDVKDNLIWAIEELQRWEDGAAMVSQTVRQTSRRATTIPDTDSCPPPRPLQRQLQPVDEKG